MYKKVLIPIDVAVPADTEALLGTAAGLTATWDCELHIATVIPSVGMAIVGSHFDERFERESKSAAQEQLSAVLSKAGIDATQHVLTGSVYDSVISCAEDIGADLIIIGAHQPKLRDYLLGANAAKVVRHSKQSVLVVRNAD